MGGAGNPRGIWHFQVFECQFPHPWVAIKSQIPTPGDHRPWIVMLTNSGTHNTPPTPEDILVINGTTNFVHFPKFPQMERTYSSFSNCTQPLILCVYCVHYVMRHFSIAGNLTHILYSFPAPPYIIIIIIIIIINNNAILYTDGLYHARWFSIGHCENI